MPIIGVVQYKGRLTWGKNQVRPLKGNDLTSKPFTSKLLQMKHDPEGWSGQFQYFQIYSLKGNVGNYSPSEALLNLNNTSMLFVARCDGEALITLFRCVNSSQKKDNHL